MEEDKCVAVSTARKRAKHTPPPPTAGFKGVVAQQNGRWGAQIYANHRRVWLGTFETEAEAAMAYDSAGIRLRGCNSHRNFPWTDTREAEFQAGLPTDTLLTMIRDGSYRAKLEEFLSNAGANANTRALLAAGPPVAVAVAFRQLFRKELTPSDVGKLNRLVIPKKHAVACFPSVVGAGDRLIFRDAAMRAWEFRYCYWKSSQSFVLTRGWNRFVKENRLRQNDIVAFYACNRAPGGTFLVIDAVRKPDDDNAAAAEAKQCDDNVDEDCEKLADDQELVEKAENDRPIGGIRLFGVQIDACKG